MFGKRYRPCFNLKCITNICSDEEDSDESDSEEQDISGINGEHGQATRK